MINRINKSAENVMRIIIYAILTAYAVFIVFISPSPAVVSKEAFLVLLLGIAAISWVTQQLISDSTRFSLGKFDLGVLLIGISYVVSTIVKTPNKMEAILLPGATTFVVCGVIVYFLINQIDKKAKESAGLWLFTSGVILSVVLILAQFRVFDKLSFLPQLVRDVNFNPFGGALPSAIFLLTLIPIGISVFIRERKNALKSFLAVSGVILALSLSILIYDMLPGKNLTPKFASLKTSWVIILDSLKTSPAFGVGPANYLTAFNKYRPIEYNSTDLWQTRFSTAGNFYMTAATELGFLGIFAIIFLLIEIIRSILNSLTKNELHESLIVSSVVLFLILFAVLPASPILMIPFFATLSLISGSEKKLVQIKIAKVNPKILSFGIGVVILALVGASYWFSYNIFFAEYKFKKSLDSLTKDNGQFVYKYMMQAIAQNPKVDRYHISFTQINTALASTIASKSEVTDDDKQNVTQFIQQAITEGKASAALNPERSGNWEILANIYRSILPFAQGADDYAIKSYNQAIALDPINPNLRISLGEVYYALGDYDKAIDYFKEAATLKPDLANAHYNLAVAYKNKGDVKKATEEINIALSLLNKGTLDYDTAIKELQDIENITTSQDKGDANTTPSVILPQE